MTAVILYAFNAVAPIMALIVIGYLTRRSGMVSEKSFKEINRMNFRYGFSCLCFNNLYKSESFEGFEVSYFLLIMGLLVVLTILGVLLMSKMTDVQNRKGVLAQAIFRSNYAVVGLPVAAALAGDEAVALASAYQAPTVIYYNLAAVLLLSVFSDGGGTISFRKIVKSIVTNPLIIGLGCGAAVLLLRRYIPLRADGELIFSLKRDLPFVSQVISYLGSMATPLALICLGGRLSLGEFGKYKKELVYANVMRLVLVPLGAFLLAIAAAANGFLTLSPAKAAVLIAIFSSPVAVATVAMAQEMGGDDALAGQIVITTSVLGMATMFVWIFLARFMGFI